VSLQRERHPAPEVPSTGIASHQAAESTSEFTPTASTADALEIARGLIVEHGVPVAVFRPAIGPDGQWNPDGGAGGYLPPRGWQNTPAELSTLDSFMPGDALAAVMGHTVDVLDTDVQHGGERARAELIAAGVWPTTYGTARTPSGGTHELIAPLGTGSRDGLRQGVDLKGGRPDGSGRGFIFIAPTVKRSKTTGEFASYAWIVPPMLGELELGKDDSGAVLAGMVTQALTPATREAKGVSLFAVSGAAKHVGPIPDGKRHHTLISYAGYLRKRGVGLDLAEPLMLRRLADCAQPPAAATPVTEDEALGKLHDVYARYTGGTPDLPTGVADSSVRSVTLTPASSITVRPVHWLLKDRIALGTLCLLGGREGIGKSTIAYTYVADVTRGQLPGVYRNQARAVIIAATEDSWAHTIVPRLMAARADLDRVYRVDVTTAEGVDTGLSLPRDLAALERSVRKVDAAMILLDPLMSRLDAKLDSHKDAEVRLALEPLVAIADRTGAAILGLIHVNKSTSTDPLTTLMASRAFAAVARAVLFVMLDPDDEDTRLLGQPKNNLGRTDLPTLTFTIESAHVADTDEGPVWTGRVRWTGEREQSIREALESAGESADARSATGEAVGWLKDHLEQQGGVDDSATIKARGKSAGHSQDALKRARQRLKATISASGFPRRTCWTLPGTQSEQPSGSSLGESALTALTAPTGPVSAVGAVGALSREAAPTGDQRYCTVVSCQQKMLLHVAGRTVCDRRDDAHAAARAPVGA